MKLCRVLPLAALLIPMHAARGDLVIGGAGNIVLAEESGAFDADNLAPAGTAFAFDLLGNGSFIPTHDIPNLNDGNYGNANSWIGETAGTFCGINLGATPVTIASIAFGRDNLGALTDRTLGLYTLEYTQVANPDETTTATGDPATGWAEIGTLDYGVGVGGTNYSTPPARHRYNFDPVDATGVRILVPGGGIGGGTCIDEIELYATPGTIMEPPPVVEIVASAGFEITYDGNDGDFFDQNPPPAGALAPPNLAQNGTAFGSSEFDGGGIHLIANVNDGFYGNSNSWIANFSAGDPNPTIGIDLGAEMMITAIAWGRDNGNGAFDDSFAGTDCCGGQADDRSTGTYTLQITMDADPATSNNWTTVGTIGYTATVDTVLGGGFTPHFRHEFGVGTDTGDPIIARGVRLLVPNNGICIDELELYSDSPVPVLIPVEEGGEIDAANNLADGALAFAKDVLAGRQIGSLNDQAFGDASAWAGETPDSFCGISLATVPISIQSLAFGRDNTGVETDRSLGTYVLQFTQFPNPDESNPDTDWTTIGEIVYGVGSPANPHLRHRFNFPQVDATGVRLLTPDGAAIDELEVYVDRYVPPPPPPLMITPAGGFTATWDGNDGDFFDPVAPPTGAQAPDNLALANEATAFGTSELVPGGVHDIDNLIDGTYGNSNSWIASTTDAAPFVGIDLGGSTAISAIAWGRDNGNGAFDDSDPGTDACLGQCDDRSVGTYTLQITNVADPSESTPDEDWETVADFSYSGNPLTTDDAPGGLFTEWLRHQFEIGNEQGGPIIATGVRILVSPNNIAIDEIEIYGPTVEARFEITEFVFDEAASLATITFNSEPNVNYAIDASTTLTAGFTQDDWLELGDVQSVGTSTTVCISLPGGVCPPQFPSFEDPIASPARSYRVRKP